MKPASLDLSPPSLPQSGGEAFPTARRASRVLSPAHASGGRPLVTICSFLCLADSPPLAGLLSAPSGMSRMPSKACLVSEGGGSGSRRAQRLNRGCSRKCSRSVSDAGQSDQETSGRPQSRWEGAGQASGCASPRGIYSWLSSPPRVAAWLSLSPFFRPEAVHFPSQGCFVPRRELRRGHWGRRGEATRARGHTSIVAPLS